MLLQLIIAMPLIFAKPDIIIKWLAPENSSVSIHVSGKDPILENCLNSGSELQYIYEIQICKRRPAWFDNCQDTRQLVRTINFDPIVRTYSVESLWNQAGIDSDQQQFNELSELLKFIRTYPSVSLTFLAHDLSEYVNSQRSYISIRVTSNCQGQYNNTLASISKVLSFGLAEIHGFDSGWIDFKLRN